MKNNIDWEQRLFIASTAALVGNLSSPELLQVVTSKEVVGDSFAERNAKSCVKFAKALIKELQREEYPEMDKNDIRISALNQLFKTAKELNGDWDYTKVTPLRVYRLIMPNGYVQVDNCEVFGCPLKVYFKSEEIAKKAIEILGEETIQIAFGYL